MKTWRRLECPISELRLDILLSCGQSFRWKEASPGVWTSVLARRLWKLKQNDTHIFYQVFEPDVTGDHVIAKQALIQPEMLPELCESTLQQDSASDKMPTKISNRKRRSKFKLPTSDAGVKVSKQELKCEALDNTSVYETILRDYFQLDVCLHSLYRQWSTVDPHFKTVASDFTGVRMLRQDPIENLFSFICSSNNHISRISGMVEKLCQSYGERLLDQDGQVFHAFPTVEALSADGVEDRLRQLGFGYRAKYIHQTALYIVNHHSEAWLHSLRQRPYKEAHAELIKLCGVGAKVADCVCLMSLDKPGAIPVDTHVWQIAKRDYRLSGTQQNKTLTASVYKEIGDYFRELWGEYAGWAHSVLFSADLKKFQDRKSSS